MILAWIASAFILGIVIGRPMAASPAIGILCILAALWLYFRRRRWSTVFPVMAAVVMGCARVPTASPVLGPDQVQFYVGRSISLQGVVSAEPDIRDTSARFEVSVDARVTVAGLRPIHGLLLLNTARGTVLEYGDRVQITGRLQLPSDNSGFHYRAMLARRGIDTELRYPRVLHLGHTSAGISTWVVPLRQRIESGIDRWLPEPEAALLIAITLGARSASLGDIAPMLVATGLIHIIAISGIKVAMVAGTFHQLVRHTGHRLLTLLASTAGILVYVALTGNTASGLRSAGMWLLVFLAEFLGRHTVALVSLPAVAAVMLATDPSLVGDIGFLLSTVGTFSIVALAGPLQRTMRLIPSPFREAFCVTLAAQIGTIPLVAIGFHSVSLVGPLANALVLPLLPALIILGFVVGLLSPAGWVAFPCGALCDAVLRGVLGLTHWLTQLPTSVPAGNPPAIVIAAYYVCLAGGAAMVLRVSHWAPAGEWSSRRREVIFTGAVSMSLLTGSLLPRSAGAAELRWLGTGSAFLLTTPHRTVLIDGSSQSLVLLQRLGDLVPYRTRTIDLIVVTTPDSSNIVGLRSVLDHYEIGEVLDVGAEYPTSTYAAWRSFLRGRHIPVYALRTAARLYLDSVRFDVLGPDGICASPHVCAGLLKLSRGRDSILLGGMAGREDQFEALFRGVHLHATELVLTSPEGIDPRFARAVHASRTLILPGVNGRRAATQVLRIWP